MQTIDKIVDAVIAGKHIFLPRRAGNSEIARRLRQRFELPSQRENERIAVQEPDPSSFSMFWECPTCQSCVLSLLDYCPSCSPSEKTK